MGFFDYISDLYESLSIQTAEAEQQQSSGKNDPTNAIRAKEQPMCQQCMKAALLRPAYR